MPVDPVKRSGLKYRPDIDGLRAIAVLSVIAFHAEVSRFTGGFVGVDVFFVISGYLISSIIFAEVAGSRFSVTRFYERRIRRIFPALFAMLAVFTVFAAIYLLPVEFVTYGKSMIAATMSISNLYFWRHSGYFDLPTSQPLLHTWSLAVEEQFYILFPLLLVLIRRFFPRYLRHAVVVLFCASLFASEFIVRRSPEAAFYMPFTRAWELLTGTILSLQMLPRLRSVWQRNLIAITGIVMIAYSVMWYSRGTLFPGFSALLPCVGTACVIWAGEAGSSAVGWLLSTRPFVFTGLISYSLYLWHWPVIVLRRMGALLGVSAIATDSHSALLSMRHFDMLVEVTTSFVLATLSWRFIERPFRNGRLRLSGRPLFAAAGAVVCTLLGLSSWIVLSGGFKSRFPMEAQRVAAALAGNGEFAAMRTGTCFITSDDHFSQYNVNLCLHEDRNKSNYLLLGDSHSAMLWSALANTLQNVNVMQASTNACVPSLDPSGSSDCKKMMDYLFQSYLPTHRLQGLFVVARWQPRDLAGLTKVIDWASRHQLPITVFGPVPEYDGPLPRLLAYSIAWDEPGLASRHLVNDLAPLDAEMQKMADQDWHVPYISLYREICSGNGCAEYADPAHTVPLMGDTNHLTSLGATFVVRGLVQKGELP